MSVWFVGMVHSKFQVLKLHLIKLMRTYTIGVSCVSHDLYLMIMYNNDLSIHDNVQDRIIKKQNGLIPL